MKPDIIGLPIKEAKKVLKEENIQYITESKFSLRRRNTVCGVDYSNDVATVYVSKRNIVLPIVIISLIIIPFASTFTTSFSSFVSNIISDGKNSYNEQKNKKTNKVNNNTTSTEELTTTTTDTTTTSTSTKTTSKQTTSTNKKTTTKATTTTSTTQTTIKTVPTTKKTTTTSTTSTTSTTKTTKTTTTTTTTTTTKAIEYNVKFIIDNNEFNESTKNKKIVNIPNTNKEGYTFIGWKYNNELFDTTSTINNNITLYATYKINEYKVTYMIDNTLYKEENVEYNKDLTLYTPTKKGYTFLGWYLNNNLLSNTKVTKDMTLNAKFEINKYKITYMVDGIKYKEDNIEYNKDITLYTPTKDHYTFDGWYLNNQKVTSMKAEADVTLEARFTPNNYKVTYMVDNTVYKEENLEYLSNINIYTPSKTGYTFIGWEYNGATISDLKVTKDITLNAVFNINKYKITYMVDGIKYKEDNIEYNKDITLYTPSKEGHTFIGWYLDNQKVTSMKATKDITLNAIFNVNEYRVTYMVDNVLYKEDKVKYNDELTLYSPTKEHYTFVGWLYNNDIITNLKVTKDMTLNAKFEINKYKITYMMDNTVYKEDNVEYNKDITLYTPTKDHYTFDGWYLNNQKVTSMKAEADVTLEARFIPNNYKVTYIVDGTVYKQISLDYLSNVILYTPSKEGYTFDGWLLDNNIITELQVTNDITLNAKFTPELRKLNITKGTGVDYVDLIIDGNTEKLDISTIKNIPYDTNYTVVTYCVKGWGNATPSKTNTIKTDELYQAQCSIGTYTCDAGSYLDADSTTCSLCKPGSSCTGGSYDYNETEEQGISICPANTYSLEGSSICTPCSIGYESNAGATSCTPKTYTLTYDNNGGSGCTSKTGIYNSTWGTLCTPERTGYVFTGWDILDTDIVTGDTTATASWTPKAYTLTYDNNGGTGCTYEIRTYGSPWVTYCSPTRTGYSFNGWSGVPATVTGNVTATANWVPNIYTLTYNNNGGSGCTSKTGSYDSTWGTLCTPSATGYNFAGWYTAETGGTQITSSTAVTGNQTIYAHWNIQTFSVTYHELNSSSTVTQNYGTALKTPAAISGWTFIGWSTSSNNLSDNSRVCVYGSDSACIQMIGMASPTSSYYSGTVTSNLTLYAYYSRNVSVNVCNIMATMHTTSAQQVCNQVACNSVSINMAIGDTKFDKVGWTTDPTSFTSTLSNNAILTVNTKTQSANLGTYYSIIKYHPAVRYRPNGGTSKLTDDIVYGSGYAYKTYGGTGGPNKNGYKPVDVTLKSKDWCTKNFTYSGHTCAGWQTEGGKQKYSFGATVNISNSENDPFLLYVRWS